MFKCLCILVPLHALRAVMVGVAGHFPARNTWMHIAPVPHTSQHAMLCTGTFQD